MKKIIAATALLAACVGACKKDNKNTSIYTLQSVYASLAPTERVVTVDAVAGATFRSAVTGVRYIIPANAFQNSAGTLVTGNVQVYVTEYLKKSDMLFSGVLPISNGEPLISGGEVQFRAKQNGQELWLAPGKKVQMNIPQGGQPRDGMMLFMGQEGADGVNWTLAGDSVKAQQGIAYFGDTLGIISDSLGFANADQYMSWPNYQSFTVTASTASGIAITNDLNGYALYDEYNGLWPLARTGTKFEEHHVPNIPVHFVVVCTIDGELYAGILGATPATGATYNVVLTKTTPAQFKTQVDAL